MTQAQEHAALRALVDAVAPLMEPDYCSPFMSAWELNHHVKQYDGKVVYKQLRSAWERATATLGQAKNAPPADAGGATRK